MGLVEHHPVAHDELVGNDIKALIQRAHWQSARTVEHVAPHQYVVLGWNKDDLTRDEFFQIADAIRRYGREEVWTAPEGFYDSGKRPRMNGRYLYLADENGEQYAYWFTSPRDSVPMLNRELVSVQHEKRTRTVRTGPAMVNRTLVADRQHEPTGEQLELQVADDVKATTPISNARLDAREDR